MHHSIAVQKIDSLANLAEHFSDQRLADLVPLDFLKERASVDILQYHIRDVSLPFHIVIQQTDDAGVLQFLVHRNFVLCVLIVDLLYRSKYHFDSHQLARLCVFSEFDHPIRTKAYGHLLLSGRF